MKLCERYSPRTLADVVGQPVTLLRNFCRKPYASCWLLLGPPGVGKTATAYALAADLGCRDEFSGLHTVAACDLSIDVTRDLFQSTLRLRTMEGKGWRVLIVEELELLHERVANYLKVALERSLPPRCVVVATSNSTEKLQEALVERFTVLAYSGGQNLAAAVLPRLKSIWREEYGDVPMPAGWERRGWDGERFSVRRALDGLQRSALAAMA
jgi:DNA polymerase III delta prime subunit